MGSAGQGVGEMEFVPMTPKKKTSWHCTLSLHCAQMHRVSVGCDFRNAAPPALSHTLPLHWVIRRTTVIPDGGPYLLTYMSSFNPPPSKPVR